MSWKIDTAHGNDIIHIQAVGTFSFAELLSLAGDGGRFASIGYAERILVDFLGSTVAETADLDLYHLPILYEGLQVAQGCRIAVTLPGSHVKYGLYQSYAEISRRSGYNLSLFTSSTRALEWLGSSQQRPTAYTAAAVVTFGPLRPVTGEQ